MNICDYIPKGHENAVTRQYLRSVLSLPDRDIRRAIAESEEPIFWKENEGYFRHKNKKDRPYEERYLRQEQARARTLRKRIRKLKAAVNG